MRTRTVILGLAAASITTVAATPDVAAICREVTEIGSDKPSLDPDQSVLIVKRRGVVVGQDCSEHDGGSSEPGDAGASSDANPSSDANAQDQVVSTDAGASADAGISDAGISDAGSPDAAGMCTPIYGDTIAMTVQPKFSVGEGGSRFALLMVTPAPPTITTASTSTFTNLEAATAPEVQWNDVYIEDASLGYQCRDPKWNSPPSDQGCGGGGGGGGGWSNPDYTPPSADASPDGQLLTVGPYQVGVIPAPDVPALQSWLDSNQFVYDSDDLDALRPYVELGWSVIAVRIAADSHVSGAGLVPLTFTYPGTELRLPLGISRQDQFGQMFLRVYIDADNRYDLAGAAVDYAGRLPGGRFLTRNDLWAELQRTADEDPIATLAPSDTSHRRVEVRNREIRIPSSQCPDRQQDNNEDLVCGCNADGVSPWGDEAGLLGLILLCAVSLRTRRRRTR